ncbi:ArsR/SmtB family transcription factor [Streptomyces sp. NPDC086549]|uniref:ArsR/SmtB family transcription factor n=1 Tax=Streptomyces sp. NPDC086549 TaxID=3365752 RepID=UPI003820F9C3
MLRFHFTAADLGRTRVAAHPDPLWELVLSANLLGNRDGRAVFDRWRGDALGRLRTLPPWLGGMVRTLAPPKGDFPDLLTPLAGQHGIEAGLDAVLSTPRDRLARELTALGPLPAWAGSLLRGEREGLALLGHALDGYYTHVLGPYWARVEALVAADQALRARAFMSGGISSVLDSLRPYLRWQNPVLEADYPQDRDVHLDGRGLLLIPSAFCWRLPVTWIDPALPPVVVYPVHRTPQWWGTPQEGTGRDALATLLGATRAAVLRAAAAGASCGELARRAGKSVSITSYHLNVLCEAGLATSVPDGPRTLYTATALGLSLLEHNGAPCVRSGTR